MLVLGAATVQAADFTVMKEDYGQFHYNTDLQGQAAAIELEDQTTQRVRQMLNQIDVDYRIQLRSWPISYRRASQREDYGIFPIEQNEALSEIFEFVGPLAEYQWVVYVRPNSTLTIESVDDLKDLRVGGYQNSTLSRYLTEQGVDIEELPYDALNLKKLTLGYIDAWVTYNVNAESIARQAGYPTPQPAWIVKSVDVYLGINKASSADMLTAIDQVGQAL
nr:ABC transporter substrate-binding protein [Saccharospirillum impatiens]